MAFQQFDPLSYLRQQSMFDNMGGANVADNHLFTNPTPPPDPFGTSNVMNGTTFGPPRTTPKIQTQDSVLADQTTGPMHPAESANLLRLKSILDSFNPDTRSIDRYNNLLDNMPQINTPSIGRRIAAAGAAIGNVGPHFTSTGGGQEAADRVNFAPYIRDMATFKEKADPFEKAATLENNRNIQDRTLITNLIAAQARADEDAARSEDADKKNAITAKDAETRRVAAEAKATNDQQRTLIAQAMANGAKPQVINGHLYAFYPNNPKQGVDLGEFKNNTLIQLQELKDASALAVQGSKNAGAAATQTAITNRVNDPNKPTKPMTPSAVSTDRKNKVQQILAQHNELKPFIQIQGNQINFTDPVDGWLWKQKPELKKVYEDAKNMVFTPSPSTTTGLGPTKVPPPPGGQEPKYTYEGSPQNNSEMRRTLDGKTYEYSHDGGKTWGAQ